MIIKNDKLVKNPIISVIVTTYNHELYLKECLDNILSQQISVPYEIIIAEDCSKDSTREICKEYQRQHSDIILLLLQESNQGMMRNFRDVLRLVRGQFVATCSGDDYWCDKTKLQKQYDCLKTKDDYGFVRTEGYELRNGKLIATKGGHFDNEGDVRDIAIYGPLGFASSAFFKRDLLQYLDIEELIRRGITMEDYPMHAIFSHHTKFALIRERMVVYRILDTSISHQKEFAKSMQHAIGYQEARRYIMELYPNEVTWTEKDIRDAQNYARLKYDYYTFNYRHAETCSFQTAQYQKRPFVKYRTNWLLFYMMSILLHIRLK